MADANAPPSAPTAHKDIEDILTLRRRAVAASSRHERFLERVTKTVGRPSVVYISLLIALGWMILNVFLPRSGAGAAPDPPPFVGLELAVSLLALVITLTILTTQNRERRVAEDRAHLELQVNLLAEHKVAKLIALVEELRHDLPDVPNREDAVANEMKRTVDPHAVLDALAESSATAAGEARDQTK
jgi:uncharacterized membrane protein